MDIHGFNRNGTYLKKVEKVYRLKKNGSGFSENEKKPSRKEAPFKKSHEKESESGKNLDLTL